MIDLYVAVAKNIYKYYDVDYNTSHKNKWNS